MHKPFETDYARWRHLTRGYVVEIYNILNHRGDDGLYYCQVVVLNVKTKRKTAWSAEVFRKSFRPVGRKQKRQSALERLLKPTDL